MKARIMNLVREDDYIRVFAEVEGEPATSFVFDKDTTRAVIKSTIKQWKDRFELAQVSQDKLKDLIGTEIE